MRTDWEGVVAAVVGLLGVAALAATFATPATSTTVTVATGGARTVAILVTTAVLPLALAAAVFSAVGLFRGAARPSADARNAVAGLAAFALFAVLVGFLLTQVTAAPAPPEPPAGGLGAPEPSDVTRPGGGATGANGLAGLAVVAAVGLAGAGLFVLRLRDPDAPLDRPDEDDAATRAAVAEAAGTAADRLAGEAAADNAVYRAWHEMAERLDVPEPTTATPGEFAAAAVDAGLEADAVAELTGVFETVRYGDADPESYADRAAAALRRLEREGER
jgi:hypothetical protein